MPEVGEDLRIWLGRARGVLSGRIRYKGGLYSAGWVERFWRHYQRLLEGGVDETEEAIEKLEMLLPEERQRMVVEDIYPLSPLQQGLLFHALYEPEAGLYSKRMSCFFQSGLNVAAFEGAWQEVVNRHPVLRTRFVWEQLEEPLQVVVRRVRLEWERFDWRELGEAEQQENIKRYLAADQGRGLELRQAPLMRLALLGLGDESGSFYGYYIVS